VSDFDVRVKVADLAEVAKLEQFIGGQMYSVTSHEPRGLQIAVVIPYGTQTGWRTFYRAVRQFWRSARPVLLPQTTTDGAIRPAGSKPSGESSGI